MDTLLTQKEKYRTCLLGSKMGLIKICSFIGH
ncbi:MAG: hypothetical protein ACI9Q3_001272 [Maribacter sp.]